MNKPKLTGTGWALVPWMICALWGIALPATGATVVGKPSVALKQSATTNIPPCKSVEDGSSVVITLGKIQIRSLPVDTKRILVGGLPLGDASSVPDFNKGANLNQAITKEGPTITNVATVTPLGQTASAGVADVDVQLLSRNQLYLLGKKTGTMNVIIQDKNDQCKVMGVTVTMDAAALQDRLGQLLPSQKGIKVTAMENSFILSGTVSDSVKVDQAVTLARAYTGSTSGGAEGGSSVINMLQVAAPQQVMLEVKMAEVSKGLLDKLGASFGASRSNGGVAYAIAAGFLSLTGAGLPSAGGLLTITKGNTAINIDAENKDGIVKILAEPNIIAISGQEGSFLAGGRIFIPVPQSGFGGDNSSFVTLEERDFGVGLKFTPTVLENGLINLKVAPEVSELSAEKVGNSTFPSFTIRRVSTTVQLHDGQSFAIAGLIKNNITESIRRFPILGEIPILGALFRSSSFQNDKTELLFVITPRLVKPLPPDYALPTDNFNAPSKAEFFLHGQLEGKPAESAAPAVPPEPSSTPQAPAPEPSAVVPEQKSGQDGFEMK